MGNFICCRKSPWIKNTISPCSRRIAKWLTYFSQVIITLNYIYKRFYKGIGLQVYTTQVLILQLWNSRQSRNFLRLNQNQLEWMACRAGLCNNNRGPKKFPTFSNLKISFMFDKRAAAVIFILFELFLWLDIEILQLIRNRKDFW